MSTIKRLVEVNETRCDFCQTMRDLDNKHFDVCCVCLKDVCLDHGTPFMPEKYREETRVLCPDCVKAGIKLKEFGSWDYRYIGAVDKYGKRYSITWM